MMEEYSESNRTKIVAEYRAWTKKFLPSAYSKELSQERIDEADSIIESFVSYLYSFFTLTPKELDAETLEEMCLYILPRKVSSTISFFKAIVPVLTRFFSFLNDNGVIKEIGGLNKKLRLIQKDIVKNAENPQNWGMAKTLAMDAIESGIDMNDKDELDSFLKFKMFQHNFQMLAQESSGGKKQVNLRNYKGFKYKQNTMHKFIYDGKKSKIGRNDPCPCQSGKKYKRCCLEFKNLSYRM